MGRGGKVARLVALAMLGGLLSGCMWWDVAVLTSDGLAGRNNLTAGSAGARAFLVERLRPIAEGANPAGSGDAAYLQPFAQGTNVVAVIPGTELPDEYVIVGAHYDHLGSCAVSEPGDTVCNGATDNATGVAVALAVADAVARQPVARSVLIALWDAEEDGLLGSAHYVANPLVPLADTVAYVNLDIQGANLRPAIRHLTFAIAGETGGPVLQDMVTDAAAGSTLDTIALSSIFGQFRSDYASFVNVGVPSVFFSDSTGPCYHTNDDEYGIVDFAKLGQQIGTTERLTRALANTASPPTFTSAPLVVFADVVELERVSLEALPGTAPGSADRAAVEAALAVYSPIVAAGPAAFDAGDVSAVLVATLGLVDALTSGECDGFLVGSPEG
jgi:hypothetical protein